MHHDYHMHPRRESRSKLPLPSSTEKPNVACTCQQMQCIAHPKSLLHHQSARALPAHGQTPPAYVICKRNFCDQLVLTFLPPSRAVLLFPFRLNFTGLHRSPSSVATACFWCIHCSWFASVFSVSMATRGSPFQTGAVPGTGAAEGCSASGADASPPSASGTTFSSAGGPTPLEVGASLFSASLASSKASKTRAAFRSACAAHAVASCAFWVVPSHSMIALERHLGWAMRSVSTVPAFGFQGVQRILLKRLLAHLRLSACRAPGSVPPSLVGEKVFVCAIRAPPCAARRHVS